MTSIRGSISSLASLPSDPDSIPGWCILNKGKAPNLLIYHQLQAVAHKQPTIASDPLSGDRINTEDLGNSLPQCPLDPDPERHIR